MAEIDGENVNEPDAPSSEPAQTDESVPVTPTRTKVLIVVGVVVVLLVVAVGVVIARRGGSDTAKPTTSTTVASACGEGDWPLAVKGKPTAMANVTDPSFFAWTDTNGFHVRAVDPNGTTPFSGKVTASAGIIKSSVKVQPADTTAKAEVSGNTLSFSIDATKAPSGVDFSICGSTQASITVLSGDALVPIERFYVGSKGRAVFNPLIINRS